MKTLGAEQKIMPGLLRGKTAVVTGAGRGLGKAIATLFAREGACSVFLVRDRATGERTVRELAEQGLKADFGVADVANLGHLASLAFDLEQRHPRIDVLVNNAAIFTLEDRAMRPSQCDPAVIQKTLEVNLFGPVGICNAFVPLVARGGRIINVSSSMGQLAGESDGYGPAYSMSKAALNMYTQLLAADLREREIMVDCFDPGWVRTDMGGPGATREPENSAKTALFLATRPRSAQTGLFWRDRQIIPW